MQIEIFSTAHSHANPTTPGPIDGIHITSCTADFSPRLLHLKDEARLTADISLYVSAVKARSRNRMQSGAWLGHDHTQMITMTEAVADPHPRSATARQDFEPLRQLDQIVDHASELDGIMAAWPQLMDLASRLHRDASDETWRTMLRNHPVAEFAWQDPMASWSYARPRGYPGDARLIDFIYGHASVQPLVDAATPLGRAVYSLTFSREPCVAVRERRRLLARLIDEMVERVGKPDVLAVACGHLREVELSRRIGEVRRLVALDQDKESLSELAGSYPQLSGVIETSHKSVGRLGARPTILGQFDLIYAAGLYDYLEEATAAQLTAALFSALKPGGRLLFANFATGLPSEAYMDAFLDWRLIFREEEDMERLLHALPHDEVRRTRLFRGANGVVIYALAQRR